MMKHRLKIVTTLLFCLPCLLWCEESKDDLAAINQRIDKLKKEMHALMLKQMQHEVDSQRYMIADYATYRKEIEEVKNDEDKVLRLQSEIDELKKARTRLKSQR